jgi:hypothetical protein
MMILPSAVASQAIGEYKVMVNAALNVGVTPVVNKGDPVPVGSYVEIAKVELTSEELSEINSALEKIRVAGERYPEELEKRTGL